MRDPATRRAKPVAKALAAMTKAKREREIRRLKARIYELEAAR